MNRDQPRNEAILRPDFAQRVVERVRKAKRRRRVYYWALTSAVASALALAAFFSLPARNLPQQRSITLLSNSNDSYPEKVASAMEPGWPSKFNLPSFDRPLTFFFPGTSARSDFQWSEAAYWHSYDPWWTPNGDFGRAP